MNCWGLFYEKLNGFWERGWGNFYKTRLGGNRVELKDTGGEPSTQAEGCSFSTNEKKLHRTFDEELIEGTAKPVTKEGCNVAGAVRWFLWVSADRTERVFSDWRACLRVDSRCVLISISTRLRRSCLGLASRPRKLPEFGSNGWPRANDPMLLSRGFVSRSTARRPPTTSGNVNSLRSPKQASFCVCWLSGPTKDSIEIKLPFGNLQSRSGLGRRIHLCDPQTVLLKTSASRLQSLSLSSQTTFSPIPVPYL